MDLRVARLNADLRSGLCQVSPCWASCKWAKNMHHVWRNSSTRRCGLNWSFGLQPYGPEWRDGRKAFQKVFHPNIVPRFRPLEVVEARKLLRRLLQTPDNFMAHLRL